MKKKAVRPYLYQFLLEDGLVSALEAKPLLYLFVRFRSLKNIHFRDN